jgi:glycosyltransferase involved in cell wall biosynthesis
MQRYFDQSAEGSVSDIQLASVVINNYNYGRFLRDAIESALRQTYSRTEIIIVDDGSTDNSREIIETYGRQVIPVLKQNGGQASAINAGLTVSRGDVVCFLDADDTLLPTAVEKSVELLRLGEFSKVHWPLWVVDASGSRTGQLMPRHPLPEGDLRDQVRREGPSSSASPPTTGNAWDRRFLERVFPIPEAEYRLCADDYLYALAPAFGAIGRISEPQGCYRLHGQNHYQEMSFERRLSIGVGIQHHQCRVLSEFLGNSGIQVDVDAWKRNLWFHRLYLAVQEIVSIVPPEGTFILADRNRWGTDKWVAGRRRLPFLERDGEYGGPPSDDGAALQEFERLRQSGASAIIFGWPAFWWLDDYPEFRRHLQSRFPCIRDNEQVKVFDLQS